MTDAVQGKALLPQRSAIYRWGKRARPAIDSLIARSSLIGNDPVIDSSEFPWIAALQSQWESIRAEVEMLMREVQAIPALRAMSPDHRRIAQHDLWKAFFLYGYGYKVDANCQRCPRTTATIEAIPGLNSAFFSILMPGSRIEPHKGPTKGLVTCHLGLQVPPDDSCRMRLADREVGWKEGECLVFDDTYRHEVWHNGSSPRVVLLIQVKRPLRTPGKQLAALFLAGIRRSPFVQEARRNMAAWEGAMSAVDTHA